MTAADTHTPRTDAVCPHLNLSHSDMRDMAKKLRDHARTLERALAEANERAVPDGVHGMVMVGKQSLFITFKSQEQCDVYAAVLRAAQESGHE